jgi:hypothetical protein
MKRHVLIFGLLLGSIMSGHMVYMVTKLCANPDIEPNDVIGYAAMIIVFSLTYFGTRNYRNKELQGSITLGKAFKTGALIATVGSTFYVIAWLFYYYLFVPDFIDVYSQHVLAIAERHGASAGELAAKAEEMKQLKESYQNPLFVILLTYFEVLPIGLVVAFIGALFLKKKPASPENQAAG